MSTIPGESSWADAGLLPQNDTDIPVVEATGVAALDTVPSPPRPDLRDEAAEQDVVDQALEVGEDDEDYPGV